MNNTEQDDVEYKIWKVIGYNDLDGLKQLLPIYLIKYYNDENKLHNLLNNALYLCCCTYDIFRLLLEYIDIDTQTRNNRFTILMSVVCIDKYTNFNNFYRYVSWILNHVKNINLKSREGSTALSLLIEHLCEIDQIDNYEQMENVIIRMLELNADILEGNIYTSVTLCIKYKKYDLLKLLIENTHVDGIKKNITIDIFTFSQSLVHHSDKNNLYDFVELLIKYTNINELMHNKKTVLSVYDKWDDKDPEIIELLIANGASL